MNRRSFMMGLFAAPASPAIAGASRPVAKRVRGGAVMGGRVYLTGEAGPETLVMPGRR